MRPSHPVQKMSRRDLLRLLGGLSLATTAASLAAACQPAPAAAPTSAPKPTAAPPALTSAPQPAAAPTVAPKPAAAPAAEEEADTRPFVLADGQDADSLDPHAVADVAYSHNLQRGPAESLVEYMVKPDGSVDVGPLLAKSWTQENNQVFTFQLNDGVKFQDGTPFSAEAVKFNFDRILGLQLTPAGRLPKIAKVEAVSPSTARCTLEGPSTDFLYRMTQMLMVSPKSIQDHVAENDFGRKWAADNVVGTGPYGIESRTKGTETVLVKNKDYWRGWQGKHLEKIIVRLVKEPATQKLLLEKGEAQLVKNVAFTDIDALSKTPGVVVESGQAPGTLHIMFRFRGPLTDVNVRKAIVHAYDYEGLVKATFRDKADLPRGFLFSKHPFHDPSVPPMTRDMAKAKEFLARSAYPNGGFELTVLILPAFGFYQPAEAQILQDALKELNIKVNIEQHELATYYKSVEDEEKGGDMWAWSGAAQLPDYNFQARRQYHSKFKRPAGVNGGYSNPRVDALLEEDQKTIDPNRRKELWFELQKIVNDELPAVFIATPFQFLTRREELQGVPLNVYNLVPNYYNAWLKKKP